MPEEVWNTNIVGSFCNMPIMSNFEQNISIKWAILSNIIINNEQLIEKQSIYIEQNKNYKAIYLYLLIVLLYLTLMETT